MKIEKFSLDTIKEEIIEPWNPVDIARFNNQVARIAVFEGEYHEHSHQEDEFFLILEGSIIIATETESIVLNKGQGVVIPKGLKHKPSAKIRSLVLMIEPESLKSAGD